MPQDITWEMASGGSFGSNVLIDGNVLKYAHEIGMESSRARARKPHGLLVNLTSSKSDLMIPFPSLI